MYHLTCRICSNCKGFHPTCLHDNSKVKRKDVNNVKKLNVEIEREKSSATRSVNGVSGDF